MRPRKVLSVRVKNPSRGLVTRLPSDESDLMRPGDTNRTYVDAKNVRFEDGVVCAAQGTKSVQLVSAILEDLSSHWRMDEVNGTRNDSHGTNHLTDPSSATIAQNAGKIGKAVVLGEDDAGTLGVAHNATLSMGATDFSWTGWVKFTSVAGSSDIIIKSDELTEFQLKRVGTALQVTVSSDGDTTFLDLPSSVTLVINTWYFFAVRLDMADTRLDITVNATTDDDAWTTVYAGTNSLQFGNTDGNPFYLDSVSFWQRALSDEELDFLYNSGDGRDYPFLSGPLTKIHQANIIDDSDPKPLTVAAGGNLFSIVRSYDSDEQQFVATLDQIYAGTSPTADEFNWSAVDFYDKIIYAQHDNVAQYWKPALSATLDLPGLPEDDAEWDGVESFFGHLILWKEDRFKWCAQGDFGLWIPISSTAATFVMTVEATGFTQPAAGASVVIPTDENPLDEGVVVGQYIRIEDEQGGVPYTNYYLVTAIDSTGPAYSITGTLQELTGVTPETTIAGGAQILSVDANDSGESQNVGSKINGPIFQILAQGDYAYIFKSRSIQSIQFTGLANGVFFVHPEISDEGLLSRTSLIGLGDGRMVFVGHREIYSYIGGPTLTPIVQQFSRQFFAELDRSRLDEIELFHKEFKNEVWIQYPVFGGHKVLIWNYREDSASIDIYDPALSGITAIADVEWPIDPSWASLAASVTWESFDSLLSWADMDSSDAADRFTLVANGDGSLSVHGVGFNRNGSAYPALAETQDYDLGEPDIFKYVQTVLIGLQVRVPDSVVRTVYVQLGYRAWTDTDVTWTAPFPIRVQGNYAPPPVRINPGGAGRYLRLRFYSEDADVPWRITSYEIHARPGSYY